MAGFKNPDVWKKNLAYQIGDFVLYNGTVYMAIKPVPAGTDMSADYWIAFAEGAIVPTGEISITENGEVDVAQYATANVNVEGIVPTGEISITENGEVDVTEYATAIVNVEGGGEAHSVKCYSVDEHGVATEVENFVYPAVFDNQHGYFAPDTESPTVTSAHAGDVLATYTNVTSPLTLYNTIDFYGGNVCVYPGDSSFGFTAFVMPDTDVCVAYMIIK